jgi:hypothetical protein
LQGLFGRYTISEAAWKHGARRVKRRPKKAAAEGGLFE